MALNIDKNRDVKEIIQELTLLNDKIERLLDKVPTSDNTILAQLDSLFNNMQRLLYTNTTTEKGSMLYEQAVGRAVSFRERYQYKLTHGGLRKMNG